jgi:antitoxin HicB
MFAFTYPATFRKDKSGRVLVLFPDFPRSATDGANAEEAMEQAVDCLGSAVAFAMAYKEEIPRPSVPKRGQRLVPVPLWVAPKLALHWRMLDPHHATKAEKLQTVLVALGQKVVFAVENAA